MVTEFGEKGPSIKGPRVLVLFFVEVAGFHGFLLCFFLSVRQKRLYISRWTVICLGGVAASAGYGFSWMAEETGRELQVKEFGFR